MNLHRLAPIAQHIAWAVIGAGAVIGGASGLALAIYLTREKGTER